MNLKRSHLVTSLIFVGLVLAIFSLAGKAPGNEAFAGFSSGQEKGFSSQGEVQVEMYFPIIANRSAGTEVLTSEVVISTMHGFDRCVLPTVSQMQTWWDASPYYVWNIYLGGVHFYCPTPELNQSWVQAVAQQGWQFIFTWVGPQPPCSALFHKFSSDPLTAFLQGIDEAAAALDAVEDLGISGEKIIYYDLEIYSNPDATCKAAVNAFLEGWTQWLHLNDAKAGVYAAPCYSNSNITDWWNYNSPRPDDVWLAQWMHKDGYDPDATVSTSCLPETYWPGFQRLRQYSGDHEENWGGVAMIIDSDIMNGEINELTVSPSAAMSTASGSVPEQARIRAMDLVTAEAGWVLLGDRLLWTRDGGVHWQELTPEIGEGRILDVDFIDAWNGWTVLHRNEGTQEQIAVYRTRDGGETWQGSPVLPSLEVGSLLGGVQAAYLDVIDAQTAFVVLQEQSGGSFSHGRLFATLDGGLTWGERTAPLGQAVVFLDSQHGWMTGGPGQDEVYSTEDGGVTWRAQVLPGLPQEGAFVGQVMFDESGRAILPVTLLGQSKASLVLYTAEGADAPWVQSQSLPLTPGYEPGNSLPFSLHGRQWWSGSPNSSRLSMSNAAGRGPTTLLPAGLPAGLIGLDFATAQVGWALVQESACFGDKIPANQDLAGADPFTCRAWTRLFCTLDGGQTWEEILGE